MRNLTCNIDRRPLIEPFQLAGRRYDMIELLVVTIEENGALGRGEARGVPYHGDTAESLANQISAIEDMLRAGAGRFDLAERLPAGGARNAVDCALWDLESQITGVPVWRTLGLDAVRPVVTMFGCGAGIPEKMAAQAANYAQARAIKLKLLGDGLDAERVRAVRSARPDVVLSVDGNQGFSPCSFEDLLPTLVEEDVSLIEQPLPVHQDEILAHLQCPIALAADESAQVAADVGSLTDRYNVINVKLDKCGGLTSANEMFTAIRQCGLEPMVGNMFGTSLGMAPAMLLAQACRYADLDGPLFFAADREPGLDFVDGALEWNDGVWGSGGGAAA